MQVINIKHTGYKVPDGAIYIGRHMPRYNLEGSKYANPYAIANGRSRDDVLILYRDYINRKLILDPHFLDDAVGKDLACWCSPLRCHGHILIEMINNIY